MIFLTDSTGNLISLNRGAEGVLGVQEETVRGRDVTEFAVEPDKFRALLHEAITEGHAEAYEVPFRAVAGQTATCNVSLTLINAPDGSPREVVGICRNLTRRLALQDKLVRSERLAAIGKMAAGIAHEVNNPLAVIETIAGLIEDTLADERQALSPASYDLLSEAIERLHAQIKRAGNITHSLLGFARKSGAGLQQVDVTKLLDEALNLLAAEISRTQAEIRRDYSPDLPQPATDPMLLEHVFMNLLQNAIEAIEEKSSLQAAQEESRRGGNGTGEQPEASEVGWKGRVSIQTRLAAGGVEVVVEDNGVGIPEAARGKIFDLFHTSKPAGKGTGLGLAIVHNICKKLGYEVEVASEEGLWTRFTLLVPLTLPK
jgi:two-component system NtrC family sensor kinase